ncbi:MAG TPA: type II toxin-antitoxin system HicB family antitoxin, partial [Nitrospinota bacterium]|nr:type II toxin-antitoxin system HicB family antitoxin [Nitrospinota bacterium]
DRLIADLRESVRNLSQRSRYKVKVKRREFDVVMEPDLEDGGFIVECPSLPGCVSQGDSVEEALFMIGDAIEGRLEIEEGQSPRGRVA